MWVPLWFQFSSARTGALRRRNLNLNRSQGEIYVGWWWKIGLDGASEFCGGSMKDDAALLLDFFPTAGRVDEKVAHLLPYSDAGPQASVGGYLLPHPAPDSFVGSDQLPPPPPRRPPPSQRGSPPHRIVRLRHDERTRAYMRRRTSDGMSKAEVIRCLKRYVAREVFSTLRNTDHIAKTIP